MIGLDEVKATANRLTILINSTDSDAERFVAINLQQNLLDIIQQYEGLISSPKFDELVAQYVAGLEKPKE